MRELLLDTGRIKVNLIFKNHLAWHYLVVVPKAKGWEALSSTRLVSVGVHLPLLIEDVWLVCGIPVEIMAKVKG